MNIEQILIATLLEDNSKWYDVIEIVKPEQFEDKNCRICYEIMNEVNGEIDIVLLSKKLRDKGHPELIVWATKIMGGGMPTQVIKYAMNVKEDFVKRQLVSIGNLMKSLPNDKSTDQVIRDYTNELTSLLGNSGKDFQAIGPLLIDYIERMKAKKDRGESFNGIPCGLSKLDEVVDGFRPATLTIIGARPSMGKSSLICKMITHMAMKENKKVALLSLESCIDEVIEKITSGMTDIPSLKIRSWNFNKSEEMTFGACAGDLNSRNNIYVNDISVIDIYSIRAKIKRMMNSGFCPDVIFVDYLQIIDVEKGHDTFANKIARVTQGLKNIAKELNIPVVVAAQINRANGEEPPRLMDLKDSGAIEAIADVVILLHREEFYKKDSTKKGIIEVNVAKNRNGCLAYIEYRWIGETTQIKEKIQ